MGFARVDHVTGELLGQVKLNQLEENAAVSRAAAEVRLAVQVESDWDFVADGAALTITMGSRTLITTPVFNASLAALDVPLTGVSNGLVVITTGIVQHRFWKTPDMLYASVWIELAWVNDNLPYWQIRNFNATVIAHRQPRGGY